MAANANWGIWGASPLTATAHRPDDVSPLSQHAITTQSSPLSARAATTSSSVITNGPSDREADLDLHPWTSNNSSSSRSPLWAPAVENPSMSPVGMRKIPVELDRSDSPRDSSFFMSQRQRLGSTFGSSQSQLPNSGSGMLMGMRSPSSLHASAGVSQAQQASQYSFGNSYASVVADEATVLDDADDIAAAIIEEQLMRDDYPSRHTSIASREFSEPVSALSPTLSHSSQSRIDEEIGNARASASPPLYSNFTTAMLGSSASTSNSGSQAQSPFPQMGFASQLRDRVGSIAEATREAEILASMKAMQLESATSPVMENAYDDRRRMGSFSASSPFPSFSASTSSVTSPSQQHYGAADGYPFQRPPMWTGASHNDERFYQQPQRMSMHSQHGSVSEYDMQYGNNPNAMQPDLLQEFRNPRQYSRGGISPSYDASADYRSRSMSQPYYGNPMSSGNMPKYAPGAVQQQMPPPMPQQQQNMRGMQNIPNVAGGKKSRPRSTQMPPQLSLSTKQNPAPGMSPMYRAQAPVFEFSPSSPFARSTMSVGSSASGSQATVSSPIASVPPSLNRRQTAPVTAPSSAATDDFPLGVRSPLLEEFRSSKGKKYELKDIYGHVVEFSGDQHGSRFIQQRLETANSDEKETIFNEIRSNSLQLMTDVFGNYVIQKFFEHGNQMQKTILAKQMEGHMLTLSLQMYGCRVVQKAIEHVLVDQQAKLVKELEGHVLRCVKDQNGNHVIQKAIERVPAEHIEFIIRSFHQQVYDLATHPYGCRVIQRMLEHCDDEAQNSILEELHSFSSYLVQDQYGNYVIQHVIERGKPEDREKIIMVVRDNVLQFSKHKFASNVVEKCIVYGDSRQRQAIIDEILRVKSDGSLPLTAMMKDQFANYVIQKLLDVTNGQQRDNLVLKITPHLQALKKYSYGKHLVSIEKLMYLSTDEPLPLSPAASPSTQKSAQLAVSPRSSVSHEQTPASEPSSSDATSTPPPTFQEIRSAENSFSSASSAPPSSAMSEAAREEKVAMPHVQ
ncbi:armadillo-type protein [Myxozyma melibiosi]|uniref:Armadillo-type protein n=1 Tax=Myxozyma melibiosi TaxID=54550 RepID=A0ABR1FCI4_9ASCO